MKRDTIFYRIFQQSPLLLFDLMSLLPENSLRYTFESVEVKEASFRIDGVLTPPDPSGDVFFTEIQMQPDPLLYERMFAEIGNYVYRRTELFASWRSVAICPSRTTEQSTTSCRSDGVVSGDDEFGRECGEIYRSGSGDVEVDDESRGTFRPKYSAYWVGGRGYGGGDSDG